MSFLVPALRACSSIQNKQRPCSIHKHVLHASVPWQISTCKAEKANRIVPYGLAYCLHPSPMLLLLFFRWWNALTFPHISHKHRNPSWQTEEEKEKGNRFLFVFFLQPQAGLGFREESCLRLIQKKPMLKVAASHPEGHKTDKWVQGLNKTLRSNSSSFIGCKHQSSPRSTPTAVVQCD